MLTTIQELREEFRSKKRALMAVMAASGSSTRSVSTALHRLAALADDTLEVLWRQAGMAAPFALVAVGGYGRGELFPHSDVDVLVLLPDERAHEHDAELRSRIEGFIGSCWDAGLEIGSSVRTLSECLAEAEKDVTVQTSMMESRLVSGDSKLFGRFRERLRLAMDPKAFFVAKTLEMRQRHNKFEDTPYALEPNCKESPGGLRDLQVILWVAKAAGLGKNWDELARKGLATAFEIKQIKRNEALLRLIRARLHLLAGRREDRLVFDLQTAVAESFGYVTPTLVAARTTLPPEGAVPPWDGPAAERTPTLVAAQRAPGVRASEALMRRYYWAAKAVSQLNQILLLNMEERLYPSTHAPQPINERFNDKAGMLDVASDDLYQRQPHAILETFLLYQKMVGIKGLSSRT